MEKEINKTVINQIIRRRKKSFITIFFLIFLASLVVAIALPPIYKSEAVIRIDDQEIPEGIVQPTMPDYVEERIGKIRQKVLSRPRLKEIAEDFNLYSKGNNPKDVSEVIEKFRENIHMETIVSEMQSKPGGKALSFTLAFNLSYEGRDPETVQGVTDKLANNYIEEDIKRKKSVMSATNDFLKAELERLKVDIDHQEKKISKFKEKHLRELPSEVRANVQMIARLERESDKANMQLRNLNEKKLFFEAELKKIEPLSPIVIEGDRISMDPNQRLKELNIQLTKMKSIYSEKHPDIKKIKREIKQLEAQAQSSNSAIEKIKMLRHMENKLESLESELGPKHPDVIELKKEIAVVSKEVNSLMTESVKMKISEEEPDNPAYINLMTQINAINIEIQAVKEDEQKIAQSIEKYQARIEKAPNLEQELNALTRDYEASKDKYQEILNELMSTQVASNVEGMQRGQRFIIASPAYLPTKPFKPNRFAILLVGFIIALGASFIVAAFQESMDDTIKTADELRQLTAAPVLASISYITTDREEKIRRLKKTMWFLIIIVFVGSCLYIANQYVIKLDYLWSTILERIKMIV